MDRKLSVLAVLLVGVSILVCGCVAAAAGGAAAGAGGYRWASGKLSFIVEEDVMEVHEAVLAAYDDLDITVVEDDTDKLGGTVNGNTPTGESVTVDIEPQESRTVKIDVRVGFWGNRAESTRVADQIKQHL